MYDQNQRELIKRLYNNGKHKREISKILKINIKTIRRILKEDDTVRKNRSDKKNIDLDLLEDLYFRCSGYIQRVHEILTEEHGVEISYQTLTRLFRENQIGNKKIKRSESFPDIPGEEMQHDTSPYSILINGQKRKVICSGLYFRYSKIRYIKFYYRFNRFLMKCFFHEALCFLGFTAKTCIIDNTNLAVYSGTGENAIFSKEMLSFANSYGFKWKAHRIKHPNRKAGTERNFYTLETNFFPGRTFLDIEDMNKQAFDWACHRYANRPLSRTRLIPAQLFETEKPRLIKVDQQAPAPYLSHERLIDQYGYIAFQGNYYFIPFEKNGKKIISRKVLVIEYSDIIKIYQNYDFLIEYKIAAQNVRGEKYLPENMKGKIYTPKRLKRKCHEEEKSLREISEIVSTYIDFIKSSKCAISQKKKFVIELYYLSKRISTALFIQSIQRAMDYGIDNISSIKRISMQLLKNDSPDLIETLDHEDFHSRTSYQKGLFCNEDDLRKYQDLLNNEEEKE